MSSPKNNDTSLASKDRQNRKKNKRRKEQIINRNDTLESPFERKNVTNSSPNEKMTPLQLTFSDSTNVDDNIHSYSFNEKFSPINRSTTENFEDANGNYSHLSIDIKTDEKMTNSAQSNDDDPIIIKMKSILNDFKCSFNQRFDNLHVQLLNVDKKFNQKFDKLSHKIDDIYERNAVTTIIERLRADHQLEIPYLPTNRTFHASASTAEISACTGVNETRQIEFDILGFAHESTSETRPIIQSPNIESLAATSSITYLKPFNANTLICAEVTSSILTFVVNDLSLLEKGVSNAITDEKKQGTYRLLNKLFQLERCVAFLLKYYTDIQLEHMLVILFGRFNHSRHHRSPEYIYQSVFESTFATKVPLLNKLYKLDRDLKKKHLYFIC